MGTSKAAILLALALTPSFKAEAQTAGLGSVSFPTSGAPKARPAFLRGLALLHSFEYDDAADAFREAQRLDGAFAMAYWGEALTYDHPLWGEHDSTAARAALLRLEGVGQAQEASQLGARPAHRPVAALRLSAAGFARAQALADPLDARYSVGPSDSMPMQVPMYRARIGVQTVVETRHWDSLPPSPLPSRGAFLYRTALSAYHRGDQATVDKALARYRRVRDSLAAGGETIQPSMHAMERKLAAIHARMADQQDSAMAALTTAADMEEGTPFVGPPVVPPARELLGELLLELGRLPEAAAAFEAALQRTPNRSAALLGRARAAARAGDGTLVREYYGKLLVNWRRADSDLPELAEAKEAVEPVAAAR